MQEEGERGLPLPGGGALVKADETVDQEPLSKISTPVPAQESIPQPQTSTTFKPQPQASSTSLFGVKSFTGFGLKTFKGAMQKAEQAKSALEDLAAAKSPRVPQEMSPSPAPSIMDIGEAAGEGGLTQAELDHIREVAEIASQEEVPMKPPPAAAPMGLTQEELDHIKQIEAMAAGELPIPVPPASAEPGGLTQEELDHIKRITEMALQEETLVPPKVIPPAPSATELTQEELDHIARISQLAQQDFQAPLETGGEMFLPDVAPKSIPSVPAPSIPQPTTFGGFGLKTFKDAMHKTEAVKNLLDDVSAGIRGDAASIRGPAPGQLTQEELDHINRITELELQEETELTLIESPTQKEISPERDVDAFAVDRDDYPEPKQETESEEIQERISPTSSRSSLQGRQRLTSTKSGEFDIKSIPEMVSTPSLGKWYEEQLSFLRDSIADEENEDVLGDVVDDQRTEQPASSEFLSSDAKAIEEEISSVVNDHYLDENISTLEKGM
ncbi:unnamed protein product [Cylicostephanus goldi]|uniref:Uncharacterized protein n=1 Tax=Cylicostephanus goldi TaxID=71465 RepID=A0A3P7PWX8_CYLGO|nr:unnamed protein product [Cylicostephanus goldi]